MPWLSTPCRSAQDRMSEVVSALSSGMPHAEQNGFQLGAMGFIRCGHGLSSSGGLAASLARRRGSGKGDAHEDQAHAEGTRTMADDS